MNDWTKSQKRSLRQLNEKVHRQHLSAALTSLDEKFSAWKRGELDAVALNEQIHVFHDQTARELWKKYAGPGTNLLANIAEAVATGALAEGEIPDSLREEVDQVKSIWK